jgi:ATP phosphoribosyltransferase regulatory subunit
MNYVDRWLLPDGVEEILPAKAHRIENARRQLLDLYHSWGYELVIPPMIEYTDSLLIGLGQDIDLLTFRVTDQLSGRMMGIRADITPQIARMDAHSFAQQGISRLCYAGHVLHTKPKTPMSTRTPIQAGVELFGEGSLNADIEVISLMLESLETLGLDKLHIDLGHVAIYRAIADAVGFSSDQEQQYFELLQKKSIPGIKAWLAEQVQDEQYLSWLQALPQLVGNIEVLDRAQVIFAQAPATVKDALAELAKVAATITERWPAVQLYCDLSEVRGYNYHTGIVFAAFSPGFGATIARGGRYDSIGKVFGRSRPAIGFTIDISTVLEFTADEAPSQRCIFAPFTDNPAVWTEVKRLRAEGHQVISGLGPNAQPGGHCTHILVQSDTGFALETIA